MELLLPLWKFMPATAWPERIGKLCDGKNALSIQFRDFPFRHPTQQTEIVVFSRRLAATRLKHAFGTMPVQNEFWWHTVRQHDTDTADPSSYLSRQFTGFYFSHRVAIAMNDCPHSDRTTRNRRKCERVKGQDQLIIAGEFVRRYEAN